MRSSSRPNVVVFFTDQQRHDTTGLHGNPLDLTPNLDAYARRHTHLRRLFTPQPVCGPARACLQTGRYATANGCYRNGIPLATDADTLAKRFAAGGWRTAYFGKWHLGPDDPSKPGPVSPAHRGGYQHWLASNILEFTSDAYETTLHDEGGNPVRLPGFRVDAITDAAIRFVDQHGRERADEPFFLFLSHLEPHHQNHRDDYPAPEGYAERYAGRWTPPDLAALGGNSARQLPGYWGMVKRIDEAFGRLLDALRSLGQLDNTIVVFASDHGCHFKTRNGEYKRSCHDSSLRVPGVIGGPGFEGGGQVGHLLSLVDLPPTLLDACGLPAPASMQGRSILPLLRGGSAPDWPDEIFAQVSESQIGRVLRTRRWKYAVVDPEARSWRESCARPGSASYVEDALYDLQADPHELENLAGLRSHRALSDALRQRLLRHIAAAGEAPPEILPAPERESGQRKVFPHEIPG
jgi:arylsulfatase A-like enzyme